MISPGLPEFNGDTGLPRPDIPGESCETGLTGDTPNATDGVFPNVVELEGINDDGWLSPGGSIPVGVVIVVVYEGGGQIGFALSMNILSMHQFDNMHLHVV